MTAQTLTEARAEVSRYLDDEASDRWSTTEVDKKLRWALVACQEMYATAGGRFYLKQVSDATTTSTNEIALSSYNPLRILGVALKSGDRYFPLTECLPHERYSDATAAVTLAMDVVPRYDLPTTVSHPLIGSGATAAPEWSTMEEWVILRAAKKLAPKDNQIYQALHLEERDAREQVMSTAMRAGGPMMLGRKRIGYSKSYSWAYDPEGVVLQLYRRGD